MGGLVIQWREGRVVGLLREWPGACEYTVELADQQTGTTTTHRALAYPQLIGELHPGEMVLLNTAALEAGLGTGGFAMVVAPRDRCPQVDPPAGHLVKARYTPLQTMVLGVDEPASPEHELLRTADDLAGLPVVVADLHSALPAVLAGMRSVRPQLRVAYVMTDGAALPAWFSRTVAGLREAHWLTSCITAGQAFGGDLEAATVHTALLAARLVVEADAVVVAQGPGVLGTGTRWGFSGVEVGEVINAVSTLGGRPVAALRISSADDRNRHRGISHHSMTALGRVALAECDVVVPTLDGEHAALGEQVREQATALAPPSGRHRVVEVGTDGLSQALRSTPVTLSTMGRGLDEDEPAFLAAAAAGAHAARLIS